MNIGDKINLKNGHEATVTRIGMSDFIGGSYPIYVQYIKDNKVMQEVLMSDELKVRK